MENKNSKLHSSSSLLPAQIQSLLFISKLKTRTQKRKVATILGLTDYHNFLRTLYSCVIFIVDWDNGSRKFRKTTLEYKVWMYQLILALSFLHLGFEFVNMKFDFIRGDPKAFTKTTVLDLLWLIGATVNCWFRYWFYANCDTIIVTMNQIHLHQWQSQRFRAGKLLKQHGRRNSKRPLETFVRTYSKLWLWIPGCNAAMCFALFLTDPTQGRYLFSTVAESFKGSWTLVPVFLCCSLAELYWNYSAVAFHFFVCTNAPLYAVWLGELAQELSVHLQRGLQYGRNYEQALSDARKKYIQLQILNAHLTQHWLQGAISGGLTLLGLAHVCMIYAAVRLQSQLPMGTFALFSFWSIAVFGLYLVIVGVMANLVKESRSCCRLLSGMGESAMELRRAKYLRSLGIGKTKYLKSVDALKFIVIVCKISKSLLLMD